MRQPAVCHICLVATNCCAPGVWRVLTMRLCLSQSLQSLTCDLAFIGAGGTLGVACSHEYALNIGASMRDEPQRGTQLMPDMLKGELSYYKVHSVRSSVFPGLRRGACIQHQLAAVASNC